MKTRGFLVVSASLLFAALLVPSANTFRTRETSSAEPRSDLPTRAAQRGSTGQSSTVKQQIAAGYGRLPLSFEANRGQTDSQVKFLCRSSGYSLFLTGTETVLTLTGGIASAPGSRAEFRRPLAQKQEQENRTAPARAITFAVLRMKLVGANPGVRVVGVEELPGKSNYFIGNDPTQWRINLPTYAKVKYERVYPGIDLVHYGHQRQLEYDFEVAPGTSPEAIRLSFQGAQGMEIDAQGDLILHTAAGEVREHRPVVYQESAGVRQAIAGSYVLRGKDEVGFAVGQYDTSKPLVIDPTLSYSTYLGGSGYDVGYGIAVDAASNAYVTGSTTSANFPTKAGSFQTASGGASDAFVTKLNPAGDGLVYSTYLGGSGYDTGYGIAVDAAGSAYVTGSTNSTNFPTTPGSFQTASGGDRYHAFATKLNPAGNGLVYSTYLGGSGYDAGRGIAVDAAGNAYVTGSTYSTNFPTTPGSFQTAFGGSSDAFVTKLNPVGDGLVYSTYLGGRNNDTGYGIAVDADGNAYVTGETFSTNFPAIPGSFQTAPGGGTCLDPDYYYYSVPCSDAFVTKLNPAGSALVFSTYLGGNQNDSGASIAVDSAGNVYVTGYTHSGNFPTANPFQAAFGGGTSNAFVTKLNPDGSGLAYSTYLGGSSSDTGYGIAVDADGNAYVTGQTSSTNFPTVPGSFQVAFGGGADAFVTKLNPNGSSLAYSTYLGGSGSDAGYGIATDTHGNAHMTGSTSSTNFPVTPGSYQIASGGSPDVFVAKISPEDFAGPIVTLSPASLAFDNQLVGTTSAAISATLKNDGKGALTISAIAIAGPNSNAFSQTNNCPIVPATLDANTQCTVSVTFAPAASGVWSGEVSITDNALSSPHKVNLTGVGIIPGTELSLSPTSLAFDDQGVNTASAARVVTLTNTGSAALTVLGIAIGAPNSGDFLVSSNTCPTAPATVATGASCAFRVTFKPLALGERSGEVSITDNAAGGPHKVSLTGTGIPAPAGRDFVLSASPTTRTISAGQSATYMVSVTSSGGFTGSVTLSCSGAPVAASCSMSPSSANITGTNAATATVMVTTAGHSQLAPPGRWPLAGRWGQRRGLPWGIVLVALLVTVTVLTKLGRRHVKPVFLAAILLLLLCIACGKGGATPAGTSTLRITGASGGLSRSTTVTLVVN